MILVGIKCLFTFNKDVIQRKNNIYISLLTAQFSLNFNLSEFPWRENFFKYFKKNLSSVDYPSLYNDDTYLLMNAFMHEFTYLYDFNEILEKYREAEQKNV